MVMPVVRKDEGRTCASGNTKIIDSNRDTPCWASSGMSWLRAVMTVAGEDEGRTETHLVVQVKCHALRPVLTEVISSDRAT
jgi:hypothetical protein